jgi:hypothetical protein
MFMNEKHIIRKEGSDSKGGINHEGNETKGGISLAGIGSQGGIWKDTTGFIKAN